MAKKKKKTHHISQTMPPEKYIRLNGRTLPITACYINEGWQEEGMVDIAVVRQHLSGHYTVGFYLVDMYCLGVKTASIQFNITPERWDDLFYQLSGCMETTYNEVHNIIYGAIAYARDEVGFEPDSKFELAKYLLEEDTDDIPLIEYEYGKDGAPFLVAETSLEADKYLPRLQKKFGESFPYLIKEEEFGDNFFDGFDFDSEDLSDFGICDVKDGEDFCDFEEVTEEVTDEASPDNPPVQG